MHSRWDLLLGEMIERAGTDRQGDREVEKGHVPLSSHDPVRKMSRGVRAGDVRLRSGTSSSYFLTIRQAVEKVTVGAARWWAGRDAAVLTELA